MVKHCIVCGKPIEEARLAASKNKASTCIAHMHGADVSKVAAMPIISGKTTYSELQFMSQEQAQEIYKKQQRRGQSPSAGVKFNKSAKTGSNQL